jgi:hypothetical protein
MMTDHELDLQLRRAAATLDALAPSFDVARLPAPAHARMRVARVAVVCVLALTLVGAASAAVTSIRSLFVVDEVAVLAPDEPGVAPPFAGREVPVSVASHVVPFRVRTIQSLGAPAEAHVRDDIAGGMLTLGYGDGLRLTQWRSSDVSARIALVPLEGDAEQLAVGQIDALWVEGTARGTFTLVGADAAVHREHFEVATGALLWTSGAMTYLLQGADGKADAARLASELA